MTKDAKAPTVAGADDKQPSSPKGTKAPATNPKGSPVKSTNAPAGVAAPSSRAPSSPDTNSNPGVKKKKGKGGKGFEPTSKPTLSSAPSEQPTICTDDLDWKLIDDKTWGQPHPLAGISCIELAELAPTKKMGEWCDYLNQDVIDTKCAAEACCFCGGGTHKELPCEDIEGWKIDNKLECEFIEISSDPAKLCGIFKNYQFKSIKASGCKCRAVTPKYSYYRCKCMLLCSQLIRLTCFHTDPFYLQIGVLRLWRRDETC